MEGTQDKASQYGKLVALRKTCHQCPGLVNPSMVQGGQYDSDHIGPWSRWQGNLNAPLLLVGQDWGDIDYFMRQRGWEKPGNPTNRILVDLFSSIGFSIGPPGNTQGQNIVFFTNAILCLKEGGLQGKVRSDWFQNCASYLRRQIQIVNPRIVVGLGKLAFDSILRAYGFKPSNFRDAVESPYGFLLPEGNYVFAVYHCGARILNTHHRFRPFWEVHRTTVNAIAERACNQVAWSSEELLTILVDSIKGLGISSEKNH